MAYTQLKIKSEYRDKLSSLAKAQNRSMANMNEVLIDRATTGDLEDFAESISLAQAKARMKGLTQTDIDYIFGELNMMIKSPVDISYKDIEASKYKARREFFNGEAE